MTLKRRWNERTRLMLTLELAVVLPAAALVFLGVVHLKSVQRDRGIQAAFQRDFNQVLLITEKQLNHKAYDLIDEVKDGFPASGSACLETMDRILATHPYIAYLFVYEPTTGLIFRTQPDKANNPAYHSENDYLTAMYKGWMQLEYKDLEKELEGMEKKGRRHTFNDWIQRGDKHVYCSGQLFLTGDMSGQKKALAWVLFDPDFLHDQLLQKLSTLCLCTRKRRARRTSWR
jgi:hypothetical protein